MPNNRDILLDIINHDVTVSRYDLQIVDGIDSTRQRLKVRLKLFLREWFLNQQAGVPYYEEFLRKDPDLDVIDALLRTAIITTPKVLEILEFSLDFDISIRRLFVDFSVRTEEGNLSLNEVLI